MSVRRGSARRGVSAADRQTPSTFGGGVRRPLAPTGAQADAGHEQAAGVAVRCPGIAQVVAALHVAGAVDERQAVELEQHVAPVVLDADLEQKVRIPTLGLAAGNGGAAIDVAVAHGIELELVTHCAHAQGAGETDGLAAAHDAQVRAETNALQRQAAIQLGVGAALAVGGCGRGWSCWCGGG